MITLVERISLFCIEIAPVSINKRKIVWLTFGMLRLFFKVSVALLSVVAAFASDESKPMHSPMRAKQLYDDGLIGSEEYGRSFYRL